MKLDGIPDHAPEDYYKIEPDLISVGEKTIYCSWESKYNDYCSASIPCEYFKDGGVKKLQEDIKNNEEYLKSRNQERENEAKEKRRTQYEILKKEFDN